MHNQSQVRSFFERMSSVIAVNAAPPLELLHTKVPANTAVHPAGFAPADTVNSARTRVSSMQWEIVDYGVGLPPLAGR